MRRLSPVWRSGKSERGPETRSESFGLRRISNQLEREKPSIQAPKMVTARSSRSVSQPRLDLNHLNSPFLWLFHQSVAGSNYLAASVAWWSLVFHFFSCSDRHHCSTQGLFCFHWNRSVLLPLLSLTSMGLQARLFARFQRSTTKNENQSKCANNCLFV